MKYMNMFGGGNPTMLVMDIKINNFFAFDDFYMDLSYSENSKDSLIAPEWFKERPNFLYKKVAVIYGSNSTGKTSLCTFLKCALTFIRRRATGTLLQSIKDKSREAYFSLDLVIQKYKLQRVEFRILPSDWDEEGLAKIAVCVKETEIDKEDSYESCAARLDSETTIFTYDVEQALAKFRDLHWMIVSRNLESFGNKFRNTSKETYLKVLNSVLRTLEPAINSVESLPNLENCYKINFENKFLLLQDNRAIETHLLSSGTKDGIIISQILSEIIDNTYGFYYCDERFSHIDSEIEESILIAMISNLQEGSQLFFTTHNKELLDLALPKHSFHFLRKELSEYGYIIQCENAEDTLGDEDVTMRSALINDYFSSVPSTRLVKDLIK